MIYPSRVSAMSPMPNSWDRTIVQDKNKEAEMHGYVDGWDWVWMTTMMVSLIVLTGAVVYAAVRLPQRDRHNQGKPL